MPAKTRTRSNALRAYHPTSNRVCPLQNPAYSRTNRPDSNAADAETNPFTPMNKRNEVATILPADYPRYRLQRSGSNRTGNLMPGTRVTINFGPFRGQRAVVVSTSQERTIVRVSIEDRSMLLELAVNMVSTLAEA